jgi:hypothetical protein
MGVVLGLPLRSKHYTRWFAGSYEANGELSFFPWYPLAEGRI